jgi:hypothetical protein
MATVRTLVTATFVAAIAAGSLWVSAADGACDPRSSCPAARAPSAADGSPVNFMRSLFQSPAPTKRGARTSRSEAARAKPASAATKDAPLPRQASKRAQKPVGEDAKGNLPVPEPAFATPAWWNATPFQGRFAYSDDNEPVPTRVEARSGADVVGREEAAKPPESAITATSMWIANADEINEIDLAAGDLPANRFWLHALMAMGGTLMVLLALAGTLAAVSPGEPHRVG